MWKIDMSSASKPFPPFLNEYQCHLRLRLGELGTHNNEDDPWWSLKGDLDRVGRDVAGLIESFALSWLERFDTRRAVIAAWERHERISREGRLANVPRLLPGPAQSTASCVAARARSTDRHRQPSGCRRPRGAVRIAA
jgi:hypothetical protein